MVRECPHCEERPEDSCDWFRPENVREVATDYKVQFGKASAVFVASECQKCFKVSWLHGEFGFLNSCFELYDWPADIRRKITAEKERRLSTGKDQWEISLCRICKVKKEVSWDYYYPYVSCEAGISGSASQDCSKFKPSKKRKSK